MPLSAIRLLLLLVFFVAAAGLNAAVWWWPNRPIPTGSATAAAPVGPIKSVSFAPFRRGQSPLTKIYPSADEVAEDLAALQGISRSVRTYTSREGLQVVPELARRYGLEVIHSAWIGREIRINEQEVEALIDQANRYPDTIKRVIVGNEVLLRKEQTAEQLIAYIRRVKAAVKQPVSYADVWEFWLKHPQLLQEVDFVTVHFLPYWEDHPIGVKHAMPHIMDVYNIVQARLPGKPILIGEVGWPSQGRARREAVPSRHDAATFITDFLRLAEAKGLDYNLVEAFDQPWKAALEGTVGGAWGVLDELRRPKYQLGAPQSELPNWPVYAALASVLALSLIVLSGPAVAALPPLRLAFAVLAAQGAGAALTAAIEHGLGHFFSTLRLAEFIAMLGLQALFAGLAFRTLVARLGGRPLPVAPLTGLQARLNEIKEYGALYLPLGHHTVSPEKMARFNAYRWVRLGDWLFAGFAIYAVYQCFMLVVAGRYRDFPIDYALLPIGAMLVLALAEGLFGSGRVGERLTQAGLFTAPDRDSPRGPMVLEGWLVYLFCLLLALMLVVEKPSNREALCWALVALGYALPMAGNLLLGRHKPIAQAAPSR